MLVKKITIYCKLVGTQIILSVFRMMIAISKENIPPYNDVHKS